MFDPGAEIQLSTINDVVQLEHRLISLDADQSGCRFQFVSCPSKLLFQQRAGTSPNPQAAGASAQQNVVSFDAFRILTEANKNEGLLPLHYFRQFSLGNLGLELLPSGAGPGSSLLRAEKKRDSLLYAHIWSKRKSPAYQQIYTKPSDTLLLNIKSDPFLQPDEAKGKKELERLIEFCSKVTQSGTSVILSTPRFGAAQHIGYHLHKALVPLVWDKELCLIAKGVKSLLPSSEIPLWLKNVTHIRKNDSRSGAKNHAPATGTGTVHLTSRERFQSNRGFGSQESMKNAVFVWVGNEIPRGFLTSGSQLWPFSECFSLGNQPNFGEILDLVQAVRPKHTLVYGENADAVAHGLRKKNLPAQKFLPAQSDTLF